MNKNLPTRGKTSRRICWPFPDSVCLQGGCSYCRDHDFVSIKDIAENIGVNEKLRESYLEGLNDNPHRIEWK